MIFDSSQILKLRQKYSGQPAHRLPRLVWLDRVAHLSGERKYLEEILKQPSATQPKTWLSRLLDTNDINHFSVWFEIMLFGWLQENGRGEIFIEPKVEGNDPDFSLKFGENEKDNLIIEAQASMIPSQELRYFLCRDEIIVILENMPKPCRVEFLEFEFNDEFDLREFEREAKRWFAECPGTLFSYRDKHRSELRLKVTLEPTLEKVEVITPSREQLTKAPLVRPLKNKATQHQALRKAGYPYLVALLIENWNYSQNELVEAWFGKMPTTKKDTVMVAKNSQHFAGVDVKHTSVGGTLVFKLTYNAEQKRRQLEGLFIQNPFALIPVDIQLFTVSEKFTVLQEHVDNFEMGWS